MCLDVTPAYPQGALKRLSSAPNFVPPLRKTTLFTPIQVQLRIIEEIRFYVYTVDFNLIQLVFATVGE